MKQSQPAVLVLSVAFVIGWLCFSLAQRLRRESPVPAPSTHTLALPVIPDFSEEQAAREQRHLARNAWLLRRNEEFDKCDRLHGIPVFGFGARVMCLKKDVVLFTGEGSPPDD